MSRIFVTGDKHGYYETLAKQLKDANATTNDVVIILGDHGTLYYGSQNDEFKKIRANRLPATLIMLRGNHDRRPTAEGYPHKKVTLNTPAYAGTFYIDESYPNILYTTEYGWYRFGTKHVYVICGAYSVDKYKRLYMQKHGFTSYHWFADEQLSHDEQLQVQSEIMKHPMEAFDIMSHTVPLTYKPTDCLLTGIDQSTVDQSTEEWLDILEHQVQYRNWYCGHWHIDRSVYKVRFLYEDLILYDEVEE